MDMLIFCGLGVECIVEEVMDLFFEVRVFVFLFDLFGGFEWLKWEMKIVEEGGVDIVIGM